MSSLSLGQQVCRTAGIFQGITALPVMLRQGDSTFEELVYYSYLRLYYFITAACTGLMAAGVLFVIIVQRHPRSTKTTTYYLEIAKSILASAMWLWLLLDSIFGPIRDTYNPRARSRKVAEAIICFFVLPILFYPTLIFAIYDKRSREDPVEEEQSATERDPLLQSSV